VELVIYNVLGQQVRRLVSGDYGAGNHTVRWDARDDRGGEAAAGVYFYRLRAGDFVQARKMLLLR
jgi:flagellar hook assembly protein FlgD